MSTRTLLFIILLVFAVTLAIVIGNRLSPAAMPIVFGVAIGVTVGIPTSVLVAIMTRQVTFNMPVEHDWQASGNGNRAVRQADRQPTFSRRSTQLSPPSQRETAPDLAFSEREFTVVGGAAPPLLDDDFSGNGGRH